MLESRTEGNDANQRNPLVQRRTGLLGRRAIARARSDQAPGQKRTFKMLMPIVNQVADGRTDAPAITKPRRCWGSDQLLQDRQRRPIARRQHDRTRRFGSIPTAQTIKTRMSSHQARVFRTTREVAVAEPPRGRDVSIWVWTRSSNSAKPLDRSSHGHDGPLSRRAGSRRSGTAIRRRSHANGAVARSATRPKSPSAVCDLPTCAAERQLSTPVDQRYTSANSMLQTDDPTIKRYGARSDGPGPNRAEQVALALERYVHQNGDQQELHAGFCHGGRSGRVSRRRLHRTRGAAGGAGSRLRHSVARGDRPGLRQAVPAASAITCGPKSICNGAWVPLDATLGQGGHRRRPSEADRLEPSTAPTPTAAFCRWPR